MTTFEKIAFWVTAAVFLVLVGGFSYKIGGRHGYNTGYEDALASIKPDTEYVEKKIYIDKPVPVEVNPAGKEMYPVGTVAELKRVIDSLASVKPDTAFIYYPVQLESKIYKDEADGTYVAQVSGWHPNLDWIQINQKIEYITKPVPEYKYPTFMLSPSVHAQALPGSFYFGAGVEIDYWKNRWQMTVEAGYDAGFVVGEFTHGINVKVGAKYNLIRQ